MTPEELLNLFDTAASSVFRMETLQHYAVSGDEERQRAFHEGHELPPPRPSKQETLAWIADSVKAGKRIYRAHVIERPLTPYMRYELEVYGENADAGEEIFVADRSAHPDLDQLRQDFVLFDDETDHPVVAWFHYSAEGRLTSYERADDPSTIQTCRQQRDLAIAHAVGLHDFRSESRR